MGAQQKKAGWQLVAVNRVDIARRNVGMAAHIAWEQLRADDCLVLRFNRKAKTPIKE